MPFAEQRAILFIFKNCTMNVVPQVDKNRHFIKVQLSSNFANY